MGPWLSEADDRELQPGDERRLFAPGANWKGQAFVGGPESNWWIYARGYLTAADNLVRLATASAGDLNFLAYPVIFLYRHHLELMLKGIIATGQELDGTGSPPQVHPLLTLWSKARPIIEREWRAVEQQKLDTAEACIAQIDKLDGRGDAFRYADKKKEKGRSALLPTLPDELAINLADVATVVGRVSWLLETAAVGLSEALSLMSFDGRDR